MLPACVAFNRDAGQVRQRRIAYLGRYPTVEAAIDGLEAELKAAQSDFKRMMSRAGAMVFPGGRYTRARKARRRARDWPQMKNNPARLPERGVLLAVAWKEVAATLPSALGLEFAAAAITPSKPGGKGGTEFVLGFVS